MKKLLALLLVIGVLVAFPLNAYAVVSFDLAKTPKTKEDAGNDAMKYYYDLELVNTSSEDVDGAKLVFRAKGSAVKSFTCVANDAFTVEQTSEDDLTYCQFNPKDEEVVSDDVIKLGQLVALIDLNAEDDDCTIEYGLKQLTGKVTVNTGSSVPYIVITGGIVLGAAVYFATKKKSKLQRI